MRISRNTGMKLLQITAVFAVLYVFLRQSLIPLIISEEFASFVADLGAIGYVIVVGYTVLSDIFAPLPGTPGILLGVTLYGIRTGMILLYAACLISATVNFWISRTFGRKFVTRLIGKKSMKEVDAFTSVEGKQALIISRLFGFPIFEFISYAAGLTNISFKNYFIITAIAGVFTNIVAYLVFRNVNLQSETGILLWVGSIVFSGIIFGFFIKSYLKRKKVIRKRLLKR